MKAKYKSLGAYTAMTYSCLVVYRFRFPADRHERSYQGYCTRSRPIAEVKLLRARPVVRWVTTCEARVLFVLFFVHLFE